MSQTPCNGFEEKSIQTPPVFSALKHEGQPLYKLARQGQSVEIESRPTSIYRLDIVSFKLPFVTLDVECSKGTYIRSLAHDLGVMLGCGAHLKGLIRTAYGPFDIKNAVTLEHLEVYGRKRLLARVWCSRWTLCSPSGKRPILSDEQIEIVRHGAGLALEAEREAIVRLRAYDKDGSLMALLSFDAESRLWRPQKVFHQPQALSANQFNP